eukprot:SM000115S23918  [mRNA]  locus=s115:179879:180502:+ [translate_table: standard]
MEELLEVITWKQLGIHNKPVGMLDVGSFYAPLLAFFDHAVAEGFVKEQNRRLVLSAAKPVELLDLLE